MGDTGTRNTTGDSNEIFDDEYDMEPDMWSRQVLRGAALKLRLVRPRSLAWAVLLEAVPEPQHDIRASLRYHRMKYEELRTAFTKDPRSVPGDDPLSQKDESVWKQHFCDNELKALILQDVVRTFPDEVYFRQKDVQDLMVRVLFVWARSHMVGYRQGMHEILAPILLELYSDRKYFNSSSISEILKEILIPQYLEHDSHMLFSAVMKGLEKFYTTGDSVPTACGRMPPSTSLHNPNEVVRYLDRIREEQLIPLDPELASHLNSCNISLELFGIRWCRLLFGREFPRAEIPLLWGFLFADGPSLPLVQYVILATLISMRNTLLDPDPGAVLSALMRPVWLHVTHVVTLALHLREPLLYPRPATPPSVTTAVNQHTATDDLEETGTVGCTEPPSDEGVAEGADVARELATLALLRAQLPSAAAALARALPARPTVAVAQPLTQILQLSALLQCRNHALVDVETALEAAEGQTPNRTVKRQLVPVNLTAVTPRHKPQYQQYNAGRHVKKPLKEVQLKVFNHMECAFSERDLPFTDPLRLRTE